MVGLMLLCHATANAGNEYDSVEKGISSYEKGDYQAALKHFIDAQIQDPDSREISYNLGNTYYKIKDYDSALKNYSEVLKGKD